MNRMSLLLAAFMIAALAANATPIDSFNQPVVGGQAVCIGIGSPPAPCGYSTSDTKLGLTEPIGGTRQISISRVSGLDAVSAVINISLPGKLSISTGTATDANVLVQHTALPTIPVTDISGDPYLRMPYAADDPTTTGAPAFAVVITINEEAHTYKLLPTLGGTVGLGEIEYFPLADWVNRATHNNITQFSIMFDTQNAADGWFGWIDAGAVPEPLTFGTLGAGLLALGLLRRRMK